MIKTGARWFTSNGGHEASMATSSDDDGARWRLVWLLDVIFSPFFLHVPVAKQIFLVQSGYFSPGKKGLSSIGWCRKKKITLKKI
jgi:hypothetical protein